MGNLELSKKYFDKLCSLDYNYRTYWFHDHKLYSHHYIEYALLLKEMEYFERSFFYFNIGYILHYHKYLNLNDIRGDYWYFQQASLLNEKMYGIFYKEYLQNNKNTSNQNANVYEQDNNQANRWSKSTTAYDAPQSFLIKNKDSFSKSTSAFKPMISDNTYSQTNGDNNKYLDCNQDKCQYDTPQNNEWMQQQKQQYNAYSNNSYNTQQNKDGKQLFKDWIDGLQFNVDYYSLLEKRGIFTFETFYQIQTMDELLDIIGKNNAFDGEILWNSSTKEYDNIGLQNLNI